MATSSASTCIRRRESGSANSWTSGRPRPTPSTSCGGTRGGGCFPRGGAFFLGGGRRGGGGGGRVAKPEPFFEAIDALRAAESQVLLLTPQGERFDQTMACRLAEAPHLILLCGRYEGFDERVRSLADREISIGDYVVSGGELPALVLIDAVVRLIPGALGDAESAGGAALAR